MVPDKQSAGEQNQPVMVHPGPAVTSKTAEQKKKCSRCGKCYIRNKKKGDRSFIEGCLFALCCCWLCDICFDVNVVAG